MNGVTRKRITAIDITGREITVGITTVTEVGATIDIVNIAIVQGEIAKTVDLIT